ncbi:hypothetical protein QZH41_009829 [Actinostola sp. cb2023]|nr:hypothetical protein QZH41_009829 [Actinostola sp. cb2023]
MPATPHTPPSHECSTPNTPETLHECSLQPNISPGRKYRIQKFTDLDDDEKDNVKQLTAILNKFGVSFEAYHEIRNHTIAAIQTTESYDNLQQSLANIINDVNHLQDQGYIYVDGLKIKLELFLGGDYKFLLLCLGMKQATCTNACIYCKVDKDGN